MISVEQALVALGDLVAPMPHETVPLRDANGRILANSVLAMRDQPPFAASSMDGYAISGQDLRDGVTEWDVVGESAAGHRFKKSVSSGQCVRIFTGAPLPRGCDHVVIQEHINRNGQRATLTESENKNPYVRAQGYDFQAGFKIAAGQRLTPRTIALLAAMNTPEVVVSAKPKIALIATGDELVQPGETPNADQIIASNTYGLHAMLRDAGADPRLPPIARDRISSLQTVFNLAQSADLIVTIGGASVGDHDLVAKAATDQGLDQSFYKVAMRPGKPLMAGHLNGVPMIGLPGNPVSAMVCGEVFLKPVIAKLLGLPFEPRGRAVATLAHDLAANGPREHYMRATVDDGILTCDQPQDSALLGILHRANALAVRTPNQAALKAGDKIPYILL